MRFVLVALVLGLIACAGEGPLLLGTLSEPALIEFAFSPDGESLIAATGEGLEWWDLKTGERTYFLPIPGIRAFALHAQSGLAALGFTSAVEIWDISARTRLLVLPYGSITDSPRLSFSPSGQVLAADLGIRLLLWDTRTGKVLASRGGAYEVPAFLSATELVLPAYPNVLLWNFISGQSVVVGKMGFRGKVIADPARRIMGYPVAEPRFTYRFVNADTQETVLEIRATGSTASWVGVLPTGDLLLPAYLPGSGQGLYMFDASSGAPKCCLTCHTRTIPEQVAVSPDGTKVAVQEFPEEAISQVSVYHVPTCRRIGSVGRWSVGTVIAKPALGGRYIVRGSRNRVEVWNAEQGVLVKAMRVLLLRDLAVSPVAPVIAVGQLYGSEILIWNWETGATWLINLRLSDPQASFANRASCLAFLPDGKALVVRHDSGALSRWDWASGERIWMTKEGQASGTLALSPRGDLAATAGAGVLRTWDLATGELRDERIGAPSIATLFFLTERDLLLGSNVGWTSAFWQILTLGPEGRVQSGRLLTAPSGAGAVLRDGRTLAILHHGEGKTKTWISLWDLQKNALIHRWELNVPCDGFLAMPGTRDVLVYDQYSVLRQYSLNCPPGEPQVLFDAESVAAGVEIRFCAEAEDPEGGPLAFAWEFGDDTIGEGVCINHVYAKPGTYTMQVTATDDVGAASSRVVQVEVPAKIRLYADFAWLPAGPWAMEEVVFLDRSRPEGAIAQRVWDFGDGGSAEGAEVRHTYAEPGAYSVVLTIYSADGREEKTERTVTVAEVSYVEAAPSPGGPPFYKVRLTAEDRAMISFGDEVQIVRRPEAPEVGEPVVVATGRVVLLEDAVAWISVLVTVEGREPRVGDRVIPVKPVAWTAPEAEKTPPLGEEKPLAELAHEEKPPEDLARGVCGEGVEAVRARLGASVEEDLAALTAGLSSPCAETRLDFIALVREIAQTELAESLGKGLLPVLAKLLREDAEPLVRIRSILALRDLGLPAEDVVPPLVEALRTDMDAEVRARAAETLGRICRKSGYTSPEVTEALRKALRDENAQVRREASTALSLLLPHEEADIPRLIALLSDPSPSVRAYAALGLGRYGERAAEAIPFLLNATGDEAAQVRYATWGAINAIKNVGEEVVPYILQGLKDPDEQVRGMVISVIQTLQMTKAEVIEGLVQLSEHQLWGHRLHVVQALGYLSWSAGPLTGKVMAALIARLFLDPHPLVRMEAARALQPFAKSKPAALEALIEALGDEHPFVGLTAAIAVGQLSGMSAPKAVVPLLRLLERVTAPAAPQWPSVQDLLQLPGGGKELMIVLVLETPGLAFAQSGGGRFIVVIPALDKSVDIMENALAKVGPPPVEDLPKLVELLQAKSAEVRLRAVRAMASLGKAALPALEALKRVAAADEDPRVREEAERVVKRLTQLISQLTSPPENEAELRQIAVQALRKAAEDPDPWVAASATQALAQLEASSEKRSLLEQLTSLDSSRRAAALEELARLDPQEKEAVLEDVLAHSVWPVILDIVEALPSLQVDEEKAVSLLLTIVGNQEEVPAVRCAAVKALGQIDPKEDRLAKELIRVLLEAHELDALKVFECFREVLVATGRVALELLLDALVQSDFKGPFGLASLISAFGSDALARLFRLAEEGKLGERAREVAARAVALMSPHPLQGVADELRSPSESRRLLAGQVLSEWTGEVALFKTVSARGYKVEMDVPDVGFLSEALQIALRDSSSTVRRLALKTIGALAPDPQATIDPLSVAKFLEDQDPDMRIQAMYVLGEFGERASGAAPALIPILQDPAPIMRVYAARALARMGVEVDQAVDVLIESLFDEHLGVVHQAVWALGELGPAAEPAVPFLLTILRVQPLGGVSPFDPLTSMKREVITALGKMGIASPEVIQELEKFTTHEDVLTRWQAAEALGRLHPRTERDELEHIQVLIEKLNDREGRTLLERDEAAQALAHYGPAAAEAVPALIRLHKECMEQQIRCAALDALRAIGPAAASGFAQILAGQLGDEMRRTALFILQFVADELKPDILDVVPLIIDALRGPPSPLKRDAQMALQGMGPEAIPMLVGGLKDPDIRAHLSEILVDLGAAVFPYIKDLIGTEDRDLRIVAIRIAAKVAIDMALPSLFELLHDEDPAIRTAAVQGLAQAGPAAAPAVPVLVKRLDDPEMQVPVLKTLGAIGPGAQGAIPLVRTLLGAPNFNVRRAAASALADMGANDEETINALMATLKDKNRLVREEAKDALVALAPASVPALLEAFGSGDALLRSYAKSALIDIGPDPLAISLLKKELVFGSPNRTEAALILSHFGEAGRDALPVLIEILLLSKEDQDRCESAIAALGRLGPVALPAVPLILEALEHESVWIRRAAARALGQIFARGKTAP